MVGEYCKCLDCVGRRVEYPCLSDLGLSTFNSCVAFKNFFANEKVKIFRNLVISEPTKTALFIQYQNHYFQQTFAADSKTLLRPDELLSESFVLIFKPF